MEKIPESFSPDQGLESKKEQEPEPFNLDFYITDHSADFEDTGNPEKLRELYADIKRDGVDSVRYDWRWNNIEPAPGNYSQDQLMRYGQAKEIMHEVGMKEPTIILSSIPDWALKLYKEGKKDEFFEAFQNYTEQVKKSLETAEGNKISTIQILNEFNVKPFTPLEIEDLPKLCQITREVFDSYNPNTKLMGTLLLSNVNAAFGIGTKLEKYLVEFEKIKDNFDVVAIDYYPGLWHWPIKEAGIIPKKEWFRQMEPLKNVLKKISKWELEYELGEVGFPTQERFSDEKKQRYFYDTFFRAFKHMLLELREQGIDLPARVGFYEASDEEPRNFKGKILRKAINPEHDFGMRESDGSRKMILQGNRHKPSKEQPEPSQLKSIIQYLRAPMKKDIKK